MKLPRKTTPSKPKNYKNYVNHDHRESLNSMDNNIAAFTLHLNENLSLIRSMLSDSDDIIVRHFNIPTIPNVAAAIVFIKSLVDLKLVESSVLSPLMMDIRDNTAEELGYLQCNLKTLLEENLHSHTIESYNDASAAAKELLAGNGIVLAEGFPAAISVSIGKSVAKEFTEPQTDRVVKGPQQGFVEDAGINVSMIRKRVKSPNLVVKELQIGRETMSNIVVMYLNNVVNIKIVNELLTRLKRIDVDGITSSGDIEEYITDNPTTLFQTTFSTERPDRVSAMLLEGRIAVVYDGSPFVIIAPSIISDFFSTSEDYYLNFYFATFNRFIRYLGAFVVTFLPAIYVAVSTFHQEMLPTRLVLTLAGTRAGVPYPAYVEAIFMEMAFEALREAGLRLPTHIGQAVSIVGALIIGQAAVEAGLVSPAVVIIVATTAIFSFTIPFTNFSLGLRLTRFFNMTLAAILGIYGIMTGFLLIGLTLASYRSFGVPFTIPFTPMSLQDMKDFFIRIPQWAIDKRSTHITAENTKKQRSNLKPTPPNEEGEKRE